MIDTTPVTGETTTKEIVEKMLGRKFEENFPKEACQIGEVLFQTEHLSGAGGKVKDVSIQVKKRRGGRNRRPGGEPEVRALQDHLRRI